MQVVAEPRVMSNDDWRLKFMFFISLFIRTLHTAQHTQTTDERFNCVILFFFFVERDRRLNCINKHEMKQCTCALCAHKYISFFFSFFVCFSLFKTFCLSRRMVSRKRKKSRKLLSNAWQRRKKKKNKRLLSHLYVIKLISKCL